MHGFTEEFARHVGTALARQLALADHLGERNWAVDITAGTASFGDDLTYRIQLLGTESHDDGTWLWAWANSESGLPDTVLRAAGWLRERGRATGPAELAEPGFPLDRADGHRLALLASGLTGNCYYRGPYPGGALFFQLEGVPAAVLSPISPERATTVLTQAIQAYALDHRTLVESFFAQQGWRVDVTSAAVTGHHPGGTALRVTFDDLGRIGEISAAA